MLIHRKFYFFYDMKKFYLSLVVLLFSKFMFSSNTQVDGIWYILDDTNNSATVTFRGDSYDDFEDEYSGNIVVPSYVEYGGRKYKVLYVGMNAFRSCQSVTSIEIPEGVKRVEDGAFCWCYQIESVSFPSSLISIGENAFTLCKSLKHLEFSNSMEYIRKNAFSHCESLESIYIPATVRRIEDGAFCGCGQLKSIIVDKGNPFYDSRNNCNAIIETSTNTLIRGGEKSYIPNSIEYIGNDAFSKCYNIKTISIPDNVKGIGKNAFSSCVSLENIEIPRNVKTIGYSAFASCKELKSVKFHFGLKSIESHAFEKCVKLASITLPASVIEVGIGAFASCNDDHLITVHVPSGTYGEFKKMSGMGYNVLLVEDK